MNIQLFLAHADDHEPVLDEGVALDMTLDAPPPVAPQLGTRRAAKLEGAPDALVDQQWAIVAPKGSLGDRLLELVAPLRRKREDEQGQEALLYRVDPGMDALAAAHWIQNEYRDAVGRRESARPRYLALLGGPADISWEFQQMLAGEAFVGRLAFDDDRGYEVYVSKLLRAPPIDERPLRASALFHSVLDGSRATREGHEHLMRPILEMATSAMAAGSFDAGAIVDIPMDTSGTSLDPCTAAGALSRQCERTRASLLFTMSHGAGVPKDGWKSTAEQRAHQGAMVLGRKGDLLTANDIAKAPFLPDGVWFMFACYGAGTPSRSAYFPWLEKLHSLGFLGHSARHVLAALPREGEAPFVAALPQAALANPDGPLGVVGHVDLAWSWSFLDYEFDGTGLVPRSRAERFQGILEAFVHGHRFGVAHHELVRCVRSVEAELAESYALRAERAIGRADFVEDRRSKVRRANLWMQRQDLGAYVLLGDPAARLPIARRLPGVFDSPRELAVSEDVERRVEAVLAVLRGTTTVGAVAKRFGVSRDEIERWVGMFVDAGRAALGR